VEQEKLENAIHNFVIALCDKSSKKDCVDFLKDEVDEIRHGSDYSLKQNITDVRDVYDELEAILELQKEESSLVRRRLLDLKLSLKEVL